VLEQGDLGLLDDDAAQRLLASTELARLGYIALDGTPRVIPTLFHWNGSEIVLPTFATAARLRAIRARPVVAVTIDSAGPPPEVLQLRGTALIEVSVGLLEEYELAHKRYYGETQGERNVASLRGTDVAMARVVLPASWVGLTDFRQRIPRALTEALS
jgi:hypothetical protein